MGKFVQGDWVKVVKATGAGAVGYVGRRGCVRSADGFYQYPYEVKLEGGGLLGFAEAELELDMGETDDNGKPLTTAQAIMRSAVRYEDAVKKKADQSAPIWEEIIRTTGDLTSTKSEPVEDVVNHPSHYTSHPSGVECIQVTEHMNFNLGNAVKYIWRAGLKDSDKTLQDLNKARFYIDREIARLSK